MQLPWYSNCSAELVMEIPRFCSSSIQSEVADEPLPGLALTDPALTMAPPYSSSFSVSVVLPASGWLIIANVLRLPASDATCSDDTRLRVGLVQAATTLEWGDMC